MAKKNDGYFKWGLFGLVRGTLLLLLYFALTSLMGPALYSQITDGIGAAVITVLMALFLFIGLLIPLIDAITTMAGKLLYNILNLSMGSGKYYFITIAPGVLLTIFTTGLALSSLLLQVIIGAILTWLTIKLYNLLGWRLPQ